MERNVRFNAITNCFGRIHDSISKLKSIAFASSEYETSAPSGSAPTSFSREKLDRILMSTAQRAKHWLFWVWEKWDFHMDRQNCHYYPCGPRDVPAPRPLYSTSCFITPHYPKRRYEDRWAIPPPFTDDNGYPVFHTVINRENEHSSNHATQEDLPIPDAPVDYDDPFPDEPSRGLDVPTFQLSQHLKGKWYNSLRKATASDPLLEIVSKIANHPSRIVVDRLLLKRGEDDCRDCPYVTGVPCRKMDPKITTVPKTQSQSKDKDQSSIVESNC